MLDETQILNIVTQELSSASGAPGGDSLEANRQAALAAYLGDPGDVPKGRSGVVSTDVADAIEWILPEIVKAFTQNNDVVTFDPVHEGDERQAELESKYVYDILMKDNDGFVILHQLIKDALLQKNGFVKVFYSSEECSSEESFTGLTEVEYNMLLARDGYEAIEESIEVLDNIPVFDTKFRITKTKKKLNVLSVAPEEFRVNSMHNSISLRDSRFTAHVMYRTRSDLVKMGFDKEYIASLPADELSETERSYRFSMQGESTTMEGGVSGDPSMDLIQIAECYMLIDIDEDGIAEHNKVTVVGWDSATHLLEYEGIDENPFISTTAILMSHKLFGLSIYDRLIQLQNQKTSLWRNILDNMYLQNNQRTIVVENQVNLDDLMISRPGGIIRAQRLDAVAPYITPPLSGDTYQMMDYLDRVRAGRVGVSPDGSVQDSKIGDRVGSEGLMELMSAKEELVGLMVRVIAETGVKPLCYMIRRLVVKHQDIVRDYAFRGKWVKVDPSKWSERSNTTVRVGTGSGNRKQQLQTLMVLAEKQEAILAKPGQTLVTPNNEYQLMDDIAKLGGFPGASPYFVDPSSDEGKQFAKMVTDNMTAKEQKQEAKDQSLLKAQLDLAQAELQKSQIQGQLATQKEMTEAQKIQLQAQKQQAEAQISMLKQQLAELQAISDEDADSRDLAFKYYEANLRASTERFRITQQTKAIEERNESDSDDE